MSAVALLDRLERVKQTGPGRWVASCPAHHDRSPSLSIRELDDGRVLLHDFGGCDAPDVLAAVGLTLADLFPEPLDYHRPGIREPKRRPNYGQVLELLRHEALVIVLASEDLRRGAKLTPDDQAALDRAFANISEIVGGPRDAA